VTTSTSTQAHQSPTTIPSQFTSQATQTTTERLERVAAIAAAGQIRAQIGYRFTLTEAVETLTQLENGALTHRAKQS